MLGSARSDLVQSQERAAHRSVESCRCALPRVTERVTRISHSLCAVRADTPDMIHDISDVLINRAFRRQQQMCDYREFEMRWRRARRSRRVQRLTTLDVMTTQEKRERWMTPAEKAARGTLCPRFLDRMPCRAEARTVSP